MRAWFLERGAIKRWFSWKSNWNKENVGKGEASWVNHRRCAPPDILHSKKLLKSSFHFLSSVLFFMSFLKQKHEKRCSLATATRTSSFLYSFRILSKKFGSFLLYICSNQTINKRNLYVEGPTAPTQYLSKRLQQSLISGPHKLVTRLAVGFLMFCRIGFFGFQER